jgi:polysaccharide export outer membrane protein
MAGFFRKFLVSFFLVFAIAGCMSGGGAAPVEQAGTALAEAPPYLLGAGDKVRITVYGEPNLTGEYNITTSGEISFPLIGNVKVVGQTIQQVQELLRNRLAGGYLLDPRVSAEVLTYRPYYILGEVGKPGQYPYAAGMTVQQAVATAGGFTYRANTRRAFVKRALDTSEHKVDLREGPIPVSPGDTIRIGERFF